MFLKKVKVRRKKKSHVYWELVETVRTALGPRHRTIAYLGELSASEHAGWAKVGRILDHRPEPSFPLFDSLEPKEPVPDAVEVNVKKVRVDRTRDFGDVYLALMLFRVLGLDELLAKHITAGREEVPWDIVASVLTIARFCEPSSELHVADTWYQRTSLDAMLGLSDDLVGKDRLYRCHDKVLPLKDEIEKKLRERFEAIFDAEFDLLLYDVTSTYFEGAAESNPQAKRGHSRDHRSDCKQVCIGLVVTKDGFPLGYEVFDGNRHDQTTLEEIVEAMEKKHGAIGRVWVVDRGIASEENLEYLREKGAMYVVGTPKSSLKKFEKLLLEKTWTEVEPGVEVRLTPGPDGDETFVLCRSSQRREKEKAMHDLFEKRIEAGLEKLKRRLDSAKKKPNQSQVERQIGRLLQKNSRSAGLFDITVTRIKDGDREGHLELEWTKKDDWRDWATLSEGCYLLRTNLTGWSPEDLWKTYIQLTQAESAFKTHKSELNLRPIWHHDGHRVQAHILFSFLAYAMWKTLEGWMAKSGLGNGPRAVLDELARIKLSDVILKTTAGREIRLQCVTKPDKHQQILLDYLKLKLPTRIGEPEWNVDPKM